MLPNVIEGTSSKGPSRHLEELDVKAPIPALTNAGVESLGFPISEKYPTYLMKCSVCSQLWQCDAPAGIKSYCAPSNWTARCIKIESQENWKQFDCTPVRIAQIVCREGGHSQKRCEKVVGKLLWANLRCKNKAVRNKALCEFCLFHTMGDW
jgi:hypothetical protein